MRMSDLEQSEVYGAPELRLALIIPKCVYGIAIQHHSEWDLKVVVV